MSCGGGDEVQIILVQKLSPKEIRFNLVNNSSTLCSELNEQGVSCQIKLNQQGEHPVLIKMFKSGQKKEISEFKTEADLKSQILDYMK